MANEQHNDPLEEFFKKKVQEYDIEYEEDDWLKLERRLDAVEAVQNKQSYWKRYSAAAAIILLLSVLAYYTYQQQQTIDKLNERLTRSEQITDTQNRPMGILPEGLFDFSVPDDPSNAPPVDRSSSDKKTNNLVNETSNEKRSNVGSRQPSSIAESHQQSLALASVPEAMDLATGDTLTGIKTPNFTGNNFILHNTNRRLTSERNNAKKTSTEFNTQHELPEQNTSGLTVGVLGGPDMSTVGGISDFYNPGYKFGLSVEYNITKNLAFSVGAIHSKVQYTASGNDYNPPEGYWSYGAAPQETVGKCLLIDIPITVKYNVLNFERSRLFASGGVSSYIMLNEDYRFTYRSYGNSQQQRWQEQTGTRHWMSNAVFSLGYEIDLRNKISLRVEPFIKVPMQEVGWANVKLYSMGSFVSVNYKIF